jgi:hypothetical protein
MTADWQKPKLGKRKGESNQDVYQINLPRPTKFDCRGDGATEG